MTTLTSINNCDIGNDSGQVSDEVLMDAAQSGDSLAFVELCRRHSKTFFRTAYGITKNKQDAEDIVQECLLKTYLHLKSFEGRCRVSSWLTRIAINTALMTLRAKRGRAECWIETPAGEPDPTPVLTEIADLRENPEQRYARQERECSLSHAIDRLPSGLREVIALQLEGDLSGNELAESLGISVAAAKSRLLRARIALRATLRRKDFVRSGAPADFGRYISPPGIGGRMAPEGS